MRQLVSHKGYSPNRFHVITAMCEIMITSKASCDKSTLTCRYISNIAVYRCITLPRVT